MTFNHIEIDYPSLSRETVDELDIMTPQMVKVSIHHVCYQSLQSWDLPWVESKGRRTRSQQGYQTSTSRGTDITLSRVLSEELWTSICQPLSEMLFKQLKPTLNKIDNIHVRTITIQLPIGVCMVVLTVSLNMKVS